MTGEKPRILSVVGYKNTGKTTLVSRLVTALKAEGYRVGTLKHDGGHDFEIDREGTDTWKHRQAGADVTLIASKSHAALQLFYEEEPALEQWLDQLSHPQFGLDILVVEGWKRSTLPKIVMIGHEKIEQLSNVIGYVSDYKASSIADEYPEVYDREDVEKIVELIKTRVFTEKLP
jgi:molybdopterin-guanine dinucleotide biosynthesis protein MobB